MLFHCIDLIIPPSFTKKLKKMDSIKGSFIDLECIVAGSHPISIQWFKDDQEISASEKYKFSFYDNTAFLEISHLESTDSGTYTCSPTKCPTSLVCERLLKCEKRSFLWLRGILISYPFFSLVLHNGP